MARIFLPTSKHAQGARPGTVEAAMLFGCQYVPTDTGATIWQGTDEVWLGKCWQI